MSANDLSRRLDELEVVLSAPLPTRPLRWDPSLRLLAWRAADLRRALESLAGHPESAMVILRALADVTIVTLWIETNPKLHTALWAAEGDRLHARDDEIVRKVQAARDKILPVMTAATKAGLAREARAIERYRAIGLRAGLKIRRKVGEDLLPNTWEQVKATGLDSLELYSFTYAVTSAWAHPAAHRMPFERVVNERGVSLRRGESLGHDFPRAFAIALQAGQFAAVSRMIGLGLEVELDFIRQQARRL